MMDNKKDKFLGFFTALIVITVVGLTVATNTVITDLLVNTTGNFSIGFFISDLIPYTNDGFDIGNSSHQLDDFWVNGVAYIDQLGETLDANAQIITNIGNAGTDFNSSGGLTLADDLGGVDATFSGIMSSATVNTGLGANELYHMNQAINTTATPTFATISTGLGANEVYHADQTCNTTAAVTHASVDTGFGANELYDMDQHVLKASNVVFASVQSGLINHSADITANPTGGDFIFASGIDVRVTGASSTEGGIEFYNLSGSHAWTTNVYVDDMFVQGENGGSGKRFCIGIDAPSGNDQICFSDDGSNLITEAENMAGNYELRSDNNLYVCADGVSGTNCFSFDQTGGPSSRPVMTYNDTTGAEQLYIHQIDDSGADNRTQLVLSVPVGGPPGTLNFDMDADNDASTISTTGAGGDIYITPVDTDSNVIIPTDCAGNCKAGALGWNTSHICVCVGANNWDSAALS